MMTVESFESSLGGAAPPRGLDTALVALWWAGKGEWGRAHGLVQQEEGNARADLVHALIHRREGDLGNAG